MAVAADIRQQVFNLLSSATNVSFVTADQETGSVSLLAPGQRVSAEVLSTMANNRVQVQIGTERYNLDLPMAVRTGQTLDMTFVASDPRSTFAIARQAGSAPPVSLSDASRLLSLLVSDEQALDPAFRSSLQNISDMLRRSSGETGVLANLMDEALTYGAARDREAPAAQPQQSAAALSENKTQQNVQLVAFETNASQILRTIAQNSRFVLVEATNQPAVPLPLLPGEEVEGSVVGTLPGGRAFVQVAGSSLEMVLPRPVQNGDILRLTFIASEPKVTFALPRVLPDGGSGALSEAGRWLSVLEHSEGGVSKQQMYVLDRLNTVLKSLPPDSPAFTAILDEAITYQTVRRGQASAAQADMADPLQASLLAAAQNPVAAGNGIVLSDDMAKLIQAVIKGNRLALLEALNQQATPTGFMPGQQLKGEVMAALGGGRFMVQVADRNMEFVLPKGVSRGDNINLFFITDEPQQTFLMVRFGRPGDSQVSETSRWLSGFLREAAGQPTAQATLGILKTLLAEPTADAPLLGKMLQQGLRESGLFYESHLARWFGSEYALDDLLKEPQGRLSSRLTPSSAQSGVPVEDFVRTAVKTGSAEVMEMLFKKAGTSMAHEGIADQRTLPVVSEQLSTLQNNQMVFRGDLFPGQNLEWTVAEREAHRDQSGGRERSWETSVTMDLPNLGPITARLTLDGTNVSIKVHAENSTAVPVLETGRMRLVEQLEGAGLTPAELSIGHVPA